MKNARLLCAAALVALTALASCKKENEDPVIVPDPELTSFKFEIVNNPEVISSDIEGGNLRRCHHGVNDEGR